MSERRVALVAEADDHALHGLDGHFAWGDGRSFAPDDLEALAAWAPGTVIALGVAPPEGPWRTIVWNGRSDGHAVAGVRRVGADAGQPWRRAPLPACDALSSLRSRPGAGVLVVGGEPAARESVVARTRASFVDARGD